MKLEIKTIYYYAFHSGGFIQLGNIVYVKGRTFKRIGMFKIRPVIEMIVD